MFVENFCGNADDMADNALTVEGNGEGSSVQIQLQSFQFVDSPDSDIFIHCRAMLCNADTDTNNCIHDCSAGSLPVRRRRRSVGIPPAAPKALNNDEHIHIALGPIRVTKN